MSLTPSFLNALFSLREAPLPPATAQQAKRCLLDTLGGILAGSTAARESCETLLKSHHSPDSGSVVIGHVRRATPTVAALINGYASHVLEMDDGVRYCSVHPGGPILSALLALAEVENISGKTLLRSIAVGYETTVRVGRALQPAHRNAGFHATGTCGCIGAAMACATALNLNLEQTQAALAAALTSASGMLLMIQDASQLKPYNSAHAASAGLSAALTGKAGICGPEELFDGPRGFLKLMSPETHPEFLSQSESQPAIHLVYVKPYAACRHCHAPVEAVLQLQKQHVLTPDQIADIQVDTYHLAAGGHDHTEIDGITSSKMSTPYCVAVALVTGKAGLQEFQPEALGNPHVLALAKKVRVLQDEALNALVPHKRPARVTITTSDGKQHTCQIDLPKGEPETLLSDNELIEKFTSLATYAGKTAKQAQEIAETIHQLETNLPDLYPLLM